MVDHEGVYLMDKPVKLYVFKDEDKVKISFRLSDYANVSKQMSIEHFRYICDNWETGVEGLETYGGKFYWYYSDCGPRPDCPPSKHVQVNVSGFSFRLSVPTMHSIVADFEYQVNNKMHWD